MISIDIFFNSLEKYHFAVNCPELSPKNVCAIYGLPEGSVNRFTCENALAIKFSMPRAAAIGDLYQEKDIFGGQYYGPLVQLDISDV